ncbi:MAG: hypothetical protein DCC43_05740 [Candidatus Brocadia sp.]|nr:hypothetical protein [Candidatus Brocadia fulgida]MCC6325731.1 caspase family protein [Candidatus Brocadia sp.]MCE7911438.1 PEGA domain-containing protein [Candidatus Brocadia sp. AMX3]MDG5995374.1 PEGA domain-containing protein [Candidatus Brocadia sp.]RIK01726.1 MAG: hypothetical protein DCC43_05740 [Candidatus Brocadia sp.]
MNTILLCLFSPKKYLCLILPVLLFCLFVNASAHQEISKEKNAGGGRFARDSLPPRQYFEDLAIRRYAVVVGISDYKDPGIADLKYADADAQAFYDFLTSPAGGDFQKDQVLLLKNEQATLKNVTLAITNFLKRAKDPDFVVIFMACHGEPEPDRPGNLYLLMHDSEPGSLSATAYHMENVNADMKRYVAAKRLIFFADACHSSGLTGEMTSTRGGANTIHAALSTLRATREGWGIVSASRAREVSVESSQFGGGHGAFTHYLLEGLKGKADAEGNKNGIVTLVEAFDFVEENVKKATHNAQHPDISGNFDNNLPLGFPGTGTGANESAQSSDTPPLGILKIHGAPEGATVFIKGKEVGAAPLDIKLVSGAYPVMIKTRGGRDVSDTVFINPDEITEICAEQFFEQVYFGEDSGASGKTLLAYSTAGGPSQEYPGSGNETGAMPSKSEKPDVTKTEAPLPGSALAVPAEMMHKKTDVQKTKENIDALIKELEIMARQQAGEEKPMAAKKPGEKRPESIAAPHAVPISLKEFCVKMGALPSRHTTVMLRHRIIDALLAQNGLLVVERDLEMQEAILREQRLGGSVLADEMYRIGLGKIQSAQFLLFGEVSQGEKPDQIMVRIEIVDTATTLINTLERTFQREENLGAVAHDIAAKIRAKIMVQ